MIVVVRWEKRGKEGVLRTSPSNVLRYHGQGKRIELNDGMQSMRTGRILLGYVTASGGTGRLHTRDGTSFRMIFTTAPPL